MKIVASTSTVSDFCEAMDRGEIGVNREYQRSDKVWPDVARSYLVETILLDYPIPKLWLNQVIDLQTRRSVKEVVDGQQRTSAIYDYFHGRYRLSSALELEEAAGKNYNELPEDLQAAFLNYGLSFDLFVGARSDEVREVFRRINSYTVPLNPEEHRHAVYQGKFKWFINRVSRENGDALRGMGVFTDKQLVRMADSKLLTEIVHALLNGITTTNKNSLDSLYKSRDKEFPEEEEIGTLIQSGIDQLIRWGDIHETALMKPYSVYSLLLAVIHLRTGVEALEDDFERGNRRIRRSRVPVENLLTLANALDDPDDADPEFEEFIEASSSKTNVAEQRRIRFDWYCRALADEL